MAAPTLRVVSSIPPDPSPLRSPRLPSGVGPQAQPKAPPVAKPRNAIEQARRESKVAYLVLAVDDLARRLEKPLAAILPAVERWGDAEWRSLALSAGQHPPSATSKAMVMERLHARASQQTVAPPAVPHLEIVTPSTWLGGDRWEAGEVLGSARIDEDPQAIADQFFPTEDVTVTPGDGHGLVALIQVGDQDDEGCSCGRTIGEIWEVSR